MGNRKNKLLTGVMVLMLTMLLLTLTFKPKKNLNIDNLESNHNNQFAFYIQNEDKNGYTQSKDKEFPEGYKLNINESKCIGNDGSTVSAASVLSTTDNKVTVTSSQTVYCTLYFDKKGKECFLENGQELRDGIEYTNGQFTYKYKNKYIYERICEDDDVCWNQDTWKSVSDSDGWGVILTDKESEAPVNTELCTTINGKPVLWASYMFDGSQAKSIDLSKSDTSNITDMSGMFNYSAATRIAFPDNFGSAVTDMSSMFSGSAATTLDLSKFNTSQVTTMESMFADSKVTTLDLSKFNTSKVTDMSSMFGQSAAMSITFPDNFGSAATDMWGMFVESKATTLDLSKFNTSKVTDMHSMFGSSAAISLDLSSFDTSQVTNMRYMFQDSSATTLVLSSFNTSKVTDMNMMFSSSAATELDLSSFDTSHVTNMLWMFSGAKAEVGYAKTQEDADRFNESLNKPKNLTFQVKPTTEG